MGVGANPGAIGGDSRRLNSTFHEGGFASNRLESHFTGKVTGKVADLLQALVGPISGMIHQAAHGSKDWRTACGNASLRNLALQTILVIQTVSSRDCKLVCSNRANRIARVRVERRAPVSAMGRLVMVPFVLRVGHRNHTAILGNRAGGVLELHGGVVDVKMFGQHAFQALQNGVAG